MNAMNEHLRRAYDSIRDLLAGAARVDVRTRHAIGAIIVEVKRSRHKYGARAVLQLSEALGTDEQTLYRSAGVAETWTAEQLDALLDRTTPLGQPLTWSHFVLLSGVADRERRERLFERTVGEGLSVRTLAALVDEESTQAPAQAPSFDRIVRTAERLTREMESAHHELVLQLAVAPRDRQVREAIEHVIAATERLRSLLADATERLVAHVEELPPRASERPVARALAGMA
jgi:hypothetical protein